MIYQNTKQWERTEGVVDSCLNSEMQNVISIENGINDHFDFWVRLLILIFTLTHLGIYKFIKT